MNKSKADKILEYYAYFLSDIVTFTKALYRWKFLSPKQEELLQLDGEINAILAGRRFGKSSLMAAKTLYYAILNPNKTCLVVGPSLEQAKIYFDLLVNALEDHPFSIFIASVKQNPFPEIKLINNSKLLFRSTALKGRYLRGRRVHWIVITEASFVDEDVFEQVIKPMRLDTKAKMWLESTPYGMGDFYNTYMEGVRNPGFIKSFHATVYDNLALSRDDIEKLRESTPELVWRVEYLAEFVDESTLVFKHDVLSQTFEDYYVVGTYKPGHKYVIGLDIAQVEDYTVFTVLDITNEPYVIADFRRFNKTTYDDIIVLANELSEAYNAIIYADATAVGRPVVEKINNVEPIVFTNKTRLEMINNLVWYLEKKKLKLPSSNTILRDELRYFRLDNITHTRSKLNNDSGKYHDDCVFSLALAVWGAEQFAELKSFTIDI